MLLFSNYSDKAAKSLKYATNGIFTDFDFYILKFTSIFSI